MTEFDSGLWRRPYYSTQVGVAFAGYCFEAMSIIALYQRCLEQLIFDVQRRPSGVDDNYLPRPDPLQLAHILVQIANRWLRAFQNDVRKDVEFLIFGFSPQDGTPFAGTIGRRESRPHLELTAWSQPLERDALYWVGDVHRQPKFEGAANEIRAPFGAMRRGKAMTLNVPDSNSPTRKSPKNTYSRSLETSSKRQSVAHCRSSKRSRTPKIAPRSPSLAMMIAVCWMGFPKRPPDFGTYPS
jgi:hypothetical protein